MLDTERSPRADLTALPFTIADIHRAYARGIGAEAIVREVFRRLEAADDPGIFISLAPIERLLAEAAALGPFDPARPLWGIPVAVKDNIDVAGLETTAACREFAHLARHDAESVARLRTAGALVIGKTNLDQFATGLVGVRTPYPVPRNAIDPSLVPGGSSSGSAVAVARGVVPIALGTDTAGSGRVPAAFNNIVGLKPSNGAISNIGMVPACRTLDCVSVFALTVDDAWTAYTAMAGFDPADPYSRQLPGPALPALPSGLRVGVPRPEDRGFSSAAAEATYNDALATIEALGATLVPIDFTSLFAVGTLLYGGPWVAERHAAIHDFLEEEPTALLPVTREIIGRATRLSAADAFTGLYRLRGLARTVEPIWSGIDFLCVPSVPGNVTTAEIAADPFGANARLGTYTNFVNLLGLCALAVPTAGDLGAGPAGITLIGRESADGLLAMFGSRVHAATGKVLGATSWPMRAAPLESCAEPDGIPLAVFGAHLSGLPLNHELVEAGAVFSREVETAADYRLHALPGAKARPGLVRVGQGGASIVGEIWLLPPAGFGRFVANVQSPLAIGTVHLDDGSTVKGFLCESEGADGTPDITRFGGWRDYLKAMTKTPQIAR